RFRVVLAETQAAAVERVVAFLESWGVPNYFGPQRFGGKGDNAVKGLAVLQGEVRLGRWKRDLMVSALQSLVFNEVLARRIEANLLDRPLPGDVLQKADSGGLFVCTDPEADAPRVDRFEVAPTGPLWGRKMVRPTGWVARQEAEVLSDFGLQGEWFSRETGSRRPLRVPLAGAEVRPSESGVVVEFLCPPGAFATSVVREITGTPAGFAQNTR
ncbi:MAG: tRNA pseudouridine(13) synthase TruD, partial [Candidatus Dadabacteria bacterium]